MPAYLTFDLSEQGGVKGHEANSTEAFYMYIHDIVVHVLWNACIAFYTYKT